MPMKRAIAIGIWTLSIFLGALNLTGCNKGSIYKEKVVINSETSKKIMNIELYVKEKIELGKFEPINGLYSGAYIQKDTNVGGDILTYDKLIGQTQTFKVFQYSESQRLPSDEILRCIAQKKTPYIKILMDKEGNLTTLYRMIVDLKASYNVPVFIELYPITSNISNPTLYKATYQRAYEVIHKYLDQAVIVWSTEDSRTYDMPLYYPGDRYVDWVGLNVYIPRYKYQEPYHFTGAEALDFWYKNFQKKKPMMLSSLAISHFSRVDYTYTVQEATHQLDYFYNEVTAAYPRLKSILYIDVDMSVVSKNGKEDYRLTSQKAISDYMKETFKALECVDTLEEGFSGDTPTNYMKYTVLGTFFDEELYISQKDMKVFFKEVPLVKLSIKEDLVGEKFYSFKEIQDYTDCYYKGVK